MRNENRPDGLREHLLSYREGTRIQRIQRLSYREKHLLFEGSASRPFSNRYSLLQKSPHTLSVQEENELSFLLHERGEGGIVHGRSLSDKGCLGKDRGPPEVVSNEPYIEVELLEL